MYVFSCLEKAMQYGYYPIEYNREMNLYLVEKTLDRTGLKAKGLAWAKCIEKEEPEDDETVEFDESVGAIELK